MKNFLINEFGVEQGEILFQRQQKGLEILLSQSKDKSNNQLKTMKSRILPRIALYQVLQEIPIDKGKALDITQKYFYTEVQKINKLMQRLEKLPGFYHLFRFGFAIGLKSDNWVCEIEQNNNESLKFTMSKCLWYDTCVEFNCPELCPMFCKSDDMTYGALKKIKFKRTQTIGTGGSCCDFQFLNSR